MEFDCCRRYLAERDATIQEACDLPEHYPRLPICVGQLGFDNTVIGGVRTRSFGGAVLHFVASAALVGLSFRVVSYANLRDWSDTIRTLAWHGVDTSGLVNNEDNVEFEIEYDEQLAAISDRFTMFIPASTPNFEEMVSNLDVENILVHLCPILPDVDMKLAEA